MTTKKKELGQFFTSPYIADFMSNLVYFNQARIALDPAVGQGVFLKHLDALKKDSLDYIAYDVDESMIKESEKVISDNVQYKNEDYLISDMIEQPDIIICNPPYNKFQDIPNRDEYIELFKRKYGIQISGYSNLCIYFLIKSLFELKDNGRCVYIMPYEFLNTGYGNIVKKYFLQSKLLKAIYKFDSTISVFDDALTTSCIFLFEKTEHDNIDFVLIKNIEELKCKNFHQKQTYSYHELDYKKKWNIYFEPKTIQCYKNLINFSSVAKVKRGIATGGNGFFALNRQQIETWGISQETLVRCVCKSADVKQLVFQEVDFLSLYLSNKKVHLFDGSRAETTSDYAYISFGEENEYHKSYINSHKNPWYGLEEKPIAPIWISVFNRNGLKVVRNETQSKNLTTFHGVYFLDNNNNDDFINIFYCYLLTPVCQLLLKECKREYGGGLDKFEPNDLNSAKILDISIISDVDALEILDLYNQIKIGESDHSQIIKRLNEIFISYLK